MSFQVPGQLENDAEHEAEADSEVLAGVQDRLEELPQVLRGHCA
jgi:hypothetical protein